MCAKHVLFESFESVGKTMRGLALFQVTRASVNPQYIINNEKVSWFSDRKSATLECCIFLATCALPNNYDPFKEPSSQGHEAIGRDGAIMVIQPGDEKTRSFRTYHGGCWRDSTVGKVIHPASAHSALSLDRTSFGWSDGDDNGVKWGAEQTNPVAFFHEVQIRRLTLPHFWLTR
jgi:hypothetical protein